MSVARIGAGYAALAPAASRQAVQSGFSVPAETMPFASPMTVSCPGAAGSASAVGGSLMLALQERNGAETGDREARQHGQTLLAALVELQRALLSGGATGSLEALSRLIEENPQAGDPVLAQVISSIRLRARIELARVAAAAQRGPGGAS